MSREPVPIGEILQEFLARTEREKVQPRHRVESAWRTVWARESSDPDATRVAQWRRGIAYIEVKSPPLCAELSQFRRRDLEAALRRELGDEVAVKRLQFRLGAW